MGGMVSARTAAVVTGSVGVLVILIGFAVASILSCTKIQADYGPPLYACSDGTYVSATNPHPYFDVLLPWVLGGLLIILWTTYRYKYRKVKPSSG
jgi:hypothetical protein